MDPTMWVIQEMSRMIAETRTSILGMKVAVLGGDNPPLDGFFLGTTRNDDANDNDADIAVAVGLPVRDAMRLAEDALAANGLAMVVGTSQNVKYDASKMGANKKLKVVKAMTSPDAPDRIYAVFTRTALA